MMSAQYSLADIPAAAAAAGLGDGVWTAPAAMSSEGCRRHRNCAYVKAIVADSLASGPFEDFLVNRDCRNARLLLNFWRDAQARLDETDTSMSPVFAVLNPLLEIEQGGCYGS